MGQGRKALIELGKETIATNTKSDYNFWYDNLKGIKDDKNSFRLPKPVAKTYQFCRENNPEQLEGFFLGIHNEVIRRVKHWYQVETSGNNAISQELKKCEDVFYFIKNWAWTYDPRNTQRGLPTTVPFEPFPRQLEYIQWLTERENNQESGIVEKSRDMGLTWLCVIYAVHKLIFGDCKITFGSRVKPLVDTLDQPDSIMEKGRIMLRTMPKWMSPPIRSKLFLIMNTNNDNSITGEGGDNMGRGGRSTIYFLDEFAFVERSHRVESAVSQNSNVCIYISTPNGNNNVFAKKVKNKSHPVFRFHWEQDPRKDKDWYKQQCEKLDPLVVAREIDIDYDESAENKVIEAKWIRAAFEVQLDLPFYASMYPRQKNPNLVAGLDIADEGADSNVFFARNGSTVFYGEAWRHSNTNQTAFKTKMRCDELDISSLYYDCVGVGAGVGGDLKSVQTQFSIVGINGGSSPSDQTWTRFGDKKGKEIFMNRRAEMWWLLRRRFEKTYEHHNHIRHHPHNELISLAPIKQNFPAIADELEDQLGWMTYFFNGESGKLQILSKKNMLKSPDHADALLYCCCSSEEANNSDWLKDF